MTELGTRVVVHLDIAVDTDPIEGSLTVGDSAPRDFHTWLELISALDEARATDGGDTR
jgi:hypothetical protein